MKRFGYTAIGFFTILGFAASATADETFQARVAYNSAQSATEIYESLNQSIRDACQVYYRKHSTTSLSNRFAIRKDCRRLLMNSAMESINRPELIALHNQSKPRHARSAVLQAARQ